MIRGKVEGKTCLDVEAKDDADVLANKDDNGDLSEPNMMLLCSIGSR